MIKITIQKPEHGRTAAAVLKERLFFSRSLLRRTKREGEVLVNGEPIFLIDRLNEGDILEVNTELSRQSDITPEEIPLDILYEDDTLLGVNKPAGMLVHPVGRERQGTLGNAVMGHWQRNCKENSVYRPINRLDRDTSGLVLISGNPIAHLSFVKQMTEKTMRRSYIALAGGRFDVHQGTIDQPIGRKAGSIIEREVSPLGSQSKTNFNVVRFFI